MQAAVGSTFVGPVGPSQSALQTMGAAPKSDGAHPFETPAPNDVQLEKKDVLGEGSEQLRELVTSEFTCDPGSVASLFSRREWTVKNILSESGADLHIDQSVEPPKIIISGKAENVKKAEQLVRDVLNYPHLQLQEPSKLNDGGMEGIVAGTLSVIEPDVGLNIMSEHNTCALRIQPDKPILSSLPLQTNLHRNSLSSTPEPTGRLHLQHQHQHQPNSAQAFNTMVCFSVNLLFEFSVFFSGHSILTCWLFIFRIFRVTRNINNKTIWV